VATGLLCSGIGLLMAAPPKIVHTFDLRPLNSLDLRVATNAARVWDTVHAASALQGLANRKAPQLHIFYCSDFGMDTDQFWFDWLRNEDGWLKNANVREIRSLEEAVEVFRKVLKGAAVYDPAVPSTSNLASTAAGCEDLLPVRYDPAPGSVYNRLVVTGKLPVKLWLVNQDGSSKFTGQGRIPDSDEPSTGSARVDAYKWALKRYVRSGRCAAGIGAYYIDAFWIQRPWRGGPTMHTLSNHDYFIARRAFFFDLSPWGDEAPNDDLKQPVGLDRKTFLEVMRALYDRTGGNVIQVGGFPP
jgi:hypothetical protein